jgi:hypothetical protein
LEIFLSCGFNKLFFKKDVKLGCVGVVVEIDEALCVRKKFNVGRIVRQQWVFGCYEVESNIGFVVAVENRSRETPLNIIRERILPGTIIVSYLWASYSTINDNSFEHFTVNHSLYFVDPITFEQRNT